MLLALSVPPPDCPIGLDACWPVTTSIFSATTRNVPVTVSVAVIADDDATGAVHTSAYDPDRICWICRVHVRPPPLTTGLALLVDIAIATSRLPAGGVNVAVVTEVTAEPPLLTIAGDEPSIAIATPTP
ncbi:hypothetical protein [Nonomuraea sp. NPDC050643]|uniref:hypothetical protein n=1 Tax=Nonomuraea sp. NPDC050643 TaxID=3155660 RepID=UPI0033ED12B3